MQNAFVESFNSRLRDECLNEHIFLSLAEARTTIEAWRDDYNYRRPHSSLGALTPVEFAQLKTEKLIPPQEGENNQRLYLCLTGIGGAGQRRWTIPQAFPGDHVRVASPSGRDDSSSFISRRVAGS